MRDNGIGIPPEMLPQVFELFAQGERDARTAPQGGLGIGLALVQKLVELHGGTRRGAQRRARARAASSSSGCRCLAASRRAGADAPRPPVAAPAAPRRILVVDDNVDAAESLGDAAAARGHEVHGRARRPAGARDRRDAERPTVVLLDIGLPGMDGYEVCRRAARSRGLDDARDHRADRLRPGQGPPARAEAGFDEHM